jgi:AraC-like DNA-binding protein
MILDFEIAERKITVSSTMMRLPGVGVLKSNASAFRCVRTRAMAEGTEHRALFICLDGRATLAQRGRQVSIKRGESILVAATDALSVERTQSRHILVSPPRSKLARVVPHLDNNVVRPMDSTSMPFRLLRGYLDLLADEPEMAGADLQHLLAWQVCELVALAVGATSDAAEIAGGHSLQIARLHAIKRAIEHNLMQGDVCLQALARRHGVSPRYIRKLLASEGTTLSQFVLGQRLKLAHRMLDDARFAHCTIGALAFDVGFSDLSSFNHAFRRLYGMTPSEVRALAAGRHDRPEGLSQQPS